MSGAYNVVGSTIAQGGTANLTSPITAVGSNVSVTGGALNLSSGGPALTDTLGGLLASGTTEMQLELLARHLPSGGERS